MMLEASSAGLLNAVRISRLLRSVNVQLEMVRLEPLPWHEQTPLEPWDERLLR